MEFRPMSLSSRPRNGEAVGWWSFVARMGLELAMLVMALFEE